MEQQQQHGFPLFSLLVVLCASLPALLSRVKLHRRLRWRQASTVSPSQTSDDPTPSSALHVFPPPRRQALSQCHHHLPAAFHSLSADKLRRASSATAGNCVPLDVPSAHVPGNFKTPTGLSMAEVRALGDFPDYACLSGVPSPRPVVGFDVDKAVPRPYRPFCSEARGGVSAPMEPDWWLEVDSTYRAQMEAHGDALYHSSEGSELACKELMELALSFLATRYPQHFALSPAKDRFTNHILGTSTPLTGVAHPLAILHAHVPEDFVLIQRDHRTGQHAVSATVHAGATDPSSSAAADPLSCPPALTSFLAALPTDRPIQRGTWRVQHAGAPSAAARDVDLVVEWQTLRRLPLSGAVVLSLKRRRTPLAQLRGEARVPALLGALLRDGRGRVVRVADADDDDGDDDDGDGDGGVEDGDARQEIVRLLDAWAAEQVADGVVRAAWVPGTLDEFPFFPGWSAAAGEEHGMRLCT